MADEILRDDFKRGNYPDVILPFTVLRRTDCILAPTKEQVLERYESLKGQGLENVEGQLRRVSGHFFYNISRFDFSRLLEDPKTQAPTSGTTLTASTRRCGKSWIASTSVPP